ncbi:MAG: hypothetical protein H7268_02285 [Sandarakinorhabdus sp.]|nr:hypothetical protein [Sandarakinorhabdus sp.]
MRILVLAAALFAVPALASSPDAMKAGLADAARACRKASNLKSAATVGAPILFSDVAGKTAVLVTGTWRPAHMKGARARMLCLYDRAARTAEAQEARDWAAK